MNDSHLIFLTPFFMIYSIHERFEQKQGQHFFGIHLRKKFYFAEKILTFKSSKGFFVFWKFLQKCKDKFLVLN